MTKWFEEAWTLSSVRRGKGPLKNDDMSESRKAGGKLIMVVTPKGIPISFTDWGGKARPPEDINKVLESLGVDVRVDKEGTPYVEGINEPDEDTKPRREPVLAEAQGS
jgi:hypothetical protein